MPPKARYTREEVIEKAISLVREQGYERLTARELGKYMGCSSRPIFTAFSTMEELKEEVKKEAQKLYTEYIDKTISRQDVIFKDVGKVYIKFAQDENNLFRLLYMMSTSKKSYNVMNTLPNIEPKYDAIIEGVASQFELNYTQAEKLYRHLWIYTHSIAVMTVTNMCTFTEENIDECLSEVCRSILSALKRGDM